MRFPRPSGVPSNPGSSTLFGCLAMLGLLTALSAGPVQAAGPAPGHNGHVATKDALEFRDDAPLPPARPVPGLRPTVPQRFGRFSSVQVNVDSTYANIPGDAANEPSLAMDPADPLRMVVGWRQFNNVHSNFRQAGYAYTTDEGRHWHFPGVLTPGTFRSDPVLGWDAEGHIGYLSLRSDSLTDFFAQDYFRSFDGGQTFGTAVPAFGGDKEWLANDRTAGIGHDNVYSFWTANSRDFTRSTNDGTSFLNPTTIASVPRWGTLAVAANGDLDLAGVDANYTNFLFSKSTNVADPNNPTPTFNTQSLPLGGTISGFTGPNPDGLVGQPWIAVDPSNGPTAGYLYAVCSVTPTTGNDPLDVHFTRSTNGGQTWSQWVRINDDPVGSGHWHWFATMSVAPDGRIDVVWNDNRNTGQQNLSQLFYSYSTNGGVSWSANQQLSSTWNSWVGWPNQDKIGDYYGMTSDRVGANLAWAATFNNEQDVWYLRINDYDCNGNGIGDSLDVANGTSHDANGNGIPDECEGYLSAAPVLVSSGRPTVQNSPNPFRGTTTISFDLPPQGGHARLEIFSVEGGWRASFSISI